MIRLLGAVLAGGQSMRFGKDKASERLGELTLLEHAVHALQAQAETVIVVGRECLDVKWAPDWPKPGLGPLGGLCFALREGRAAGYDAVLSLLCDTPELPAGILEEVRRRSDNCFLAASPVIGLWSCSLADDLAAYLVNDRKRSVHGWVSAIGASSILTVGSVPNVNRPSDLEDVRLRWVE